MEHRIPTFYKLLAAAVLIPLAGLLALTIALSIWMPPAKVRQFMADTAGRYLHREVRLRDVSLGAVKGLVVEGLEVSEKPDFAAGTFARVDSLRLRMRWLPLLRKQVVIDEITITGPGIAVVRLKPGVFNFSDLVAASSAPATAAASPAPVLTLPFTLQAGRISLQDGRITYADRVAGAQWRVSSLKAVIKQLSFSHHFGLEAGLKAEQLRPGTLKAKLDFNGQVDLSGMAFGKLSADINKLAADVSGLTMTLAGQVRLAPDRIEAPELKGRLGGGALVLKATILDYNKAPDARLDARLSQLDAAKLMEIKAAAAGPLPAAPAGKKAKPAGGPATAFAPPLKASGTIAVGKILYHKTKAENLALAWDLKGITPDLRGLSGWAKLGVAGGSFEPEDKAGGQSKLMKALLVPLAVLKKAVTLGGVLKIMPSFDKIVFSEIKGDYVFARGLMTIRDFRMNSAAANVTAGGTIDLPEQKLNLQLTIALAKLAPIGVDVGGTFDQPKPRLRRALAVTEPVKRLAQDLLQGLFKKKK